MKAAPDTAATADTAPRCRFCDAALSHSFVDLGATPLANAYLAPAALGRMEPFFPLHARVCEHCLLVQIEAVETPEAIFGDYAYFSSFSRSWLDHAQRYAAAMTARFGLDAHSLVVELASNDGYLLQYFKQAGIPVHGVEPAANVAAEATRRGIPTTVDFFGVELARRLVAQGVRPDLMAGNNVLAHVPDLNDFVAGIKILLKPAGVLTMEFPHLLQLIARHQFDTIYHEHFSYFSMLAVERVFCAHGLVLFDVDELPTHGGSLRIYVRHAENEALPVHAGIAGLKARERDAGLEDMDTYRRFGATAAAAKRSLLSFLIAARERGEAVVGYGAPAKGNTLLNYCGVGRDLLDYTVDISPHKQGRYLPGTRIPIHGLERIDETRPDYVLILPWNLADEIMGAMAHIRDWGGRFVVPIPEARLVS